LRCYNGAHIYSQLCYIFSLLLQKSAFAAAASASASAEPVNGSKKKTAAPNGGKSQTQGGGAERIKNPDQINWGKITDETHKQLEGLFAPHIESFNVFLEELLPLAVNDLNRCEVKISETSKMTFWIDEVQLAYPSKETPDDKLFPWEVCSTTNESLLLCSINNETTQ